MKVLLQTVGMGETGHEALLAVIRAQRPDRVIHVATTASAEANLSRLHARAASTSCRLPPCETWLVEDENDLKSLIDELRTKMAALRVDGGPPRLTVDFTAGTKVMSAALAWLGISERADQFLYATGERDEKGVVVETSRIVAIAGEDATASATLDEASELFNHGRYEAARDLAGGLEQKFPAGSRDRTRAISLAGIAEAYSLWDLFRWNESSQRLKSLLSPTRRGELEAAGWDLPALDRQFEHVGRCHRRKWEFDRALDLLGNAQRCGEGQRWDDAQSRLYRLIEYLAQVGVAGILGLQPNEGSPTSRLLVTDIGRCAPRLAEQLGQVARDRHNLGLRDAAKLVVEARPSSFLGEFLARWQVHVDRDYSPEGMGTLLNQRNSSWLAHGQDSARPADVRKLMLAAKEGVTALAREFGRQSDEEIAGSFGVIEFLRCPWRQARASRIRLG